MRIVNSSDARRIAARPAVSSYHPVSISGAGDMRVLVSSVPQDAVDNADNVTKYTMVVDGTHRVPLVRGGVHGTELYMMLNAEKTASLVSALRRKLSRSSRLSASASAHSAQEVGAAEEPMVVGYVVMAETQGMHNSNEVAHGPLTVLPSVTASGSEETAPFTGVRKSFGRSSVFKPYNTFSDSPYRPASAPVPHIDPDDRRSRYSPIDVPLDGGKPITVATLRCREGACPSQLKLVLTVDNDLHDMNVFLMTYAGNVRWNPDAGYLSSLVSTIQEMRGAVQLATEPPSEGACSDVVVMYRLVGYMPSHEEHGDWVEFAHGPLTFRCPSRSDEIGRLLPERSHAPQAHMIGQGYGTAFMSVGRAEGLVSGT